MVVETRNLPPARLRQNKFPKLPSTQINTCALCNCGAKEVRGMGTIVLIAISALQLVVSIILYPAVEPLISR